MGFGFLMVFFFKDEHNLLVNAQENKTKALRQMRFEYIEEIDKSIILTYIIEAIENQKLEKEIKPKRSKKETIISKLLKDILIKNKDLKNNFNALSTYKPLEYADYINSAKRDVNKLTRLEKIAPMILKGIGLIDKYKNC